MNWTYKSVTADWVNCWNKSNWLLCKKILVAGVGPRADCWRWRLVVVVVIVATRWQQCRATRAWVGENDKSVATSWRPVCYGSWRWWWCTGLHWHTFQLLSTGQLHHHHQHHYHQQHNHQHDDQSLYQGHSLQKQGKKYFLLKAKAKTFMRCPQGQGQGLAPRTTRLIMTTTTMLLLWAENGSATPLHWCLLCPSHR